MASVDWTYLTDRLLRYYYPVLIMVPTMITLFCVDRNSMVRANKKPVLALCFLLTLMILTDLFDGALDKMREYTIWRLIAAVTGFCIRPLLLLVLLLDILPQDVKTKKQKILLAAPAIVNCLVFCTAFFSPLAFSYTADNVYKRGILYFVIIVVCVIYLVLLAAGAIKMMRWRNRLRSIMVLLIAISCFIAALMEIRDIAYPTPLLNQTVAFGTTLYFLNRYMTFSADAIENMQFSLLMMQIRPHFINNSLASIRSMIRRDPEKAVDTLNHFSGYLQDSMNSILISKLIPFSQEMELIDNYLYMENTRFGDSITITKKLLPADFLIPPLTIQPLVENAVRHGLCGFQGPRHLTIRTEIDSREYRILVIDNGSGFDPAQPADPRREHVGLKNVRARLDLMCGGKLSIQSTPGSGTTAVVHIPVKNISMLQFKSPASAEK